jgi:hypothetical protein
VKARLTSLLILASVVINAELRAEPSPTDRSLAQSLFEQGKELMDSGSFEQACPKLEESQRLDPGGGTLLNLALCHEQLGKVASAWTDFKAALSDAKRDGRQDRVLAAEEHIALLAPKLPWLTLTVNGPVEGQEVKLDGAALGKAAWGTRVAVDPGTHELSASAPGKKPWAITFTMAIAENKGIALPVLQAEAVQPAPPSTGAVGPEGSAPARPVSFEPAREPSHADATIGWVIGGAGVAALGVGTFFGVRTISKKKQSDRECPTDTTCSTEGVNLNNQAKSSAWVSNIGIGLGLAGVGIGAYIIVSRSGSTKESGNATSVPARLAVDARALPGGGRVSVRGTW